jgi:hypothetical protein
VLIMVEWVCDHYLIFLDLAWDFVLFLSSNIMGLNFNPVF